MQGFGDGIALIVDERTMRGLGIFRLIVPVVAFLSFEVVPASLRRLAVG